MNWTLFAYALTILIVTLIQIYLLKNYSTHIDESRLYDKNIITQRDAEILDIIEGKVPVTEQLEHLLTTAISLQYEMKVQYIEPSEIKTDFILFYISLLSIKDNLMSLKKDHIENIEPLLDDIFILADISREAASDSSNNDFYQLYQDTNLVTETIIKRINESKEAIENKNKNVTKNIANSINVYQTELEKREQQDSEYYYFHSIIMSIIFIIPILTMVFLFSQFYGRLRIIEKYAIDIAHEKYALPPFVANDPTGRLSLFLCLVGRKIRESLKLSREHATKTEDALSEAEKLASYDPLTGLVNRRYFNKFLKKASSSYDNDNYLLFIDLDNFKDVNDILGHDIGDKLLIKISEKLLHAVRPDDVVCRMGGDEFAMFIKASEDSIEKVIQRILTSISSPFRINDETIRASMSIGVVNVQPNIATETLMKHADMAMYHAKHSGRNTFKFFTNQLEEIVVSRQGTLHQLREALVNMEFELFYQPKISLTTNRINGYEALIRWRHPIKGLIPPNDFIPIAEDSEIIHPLGMWVLEQACKDSLILQKLGIDIPVSINVAPKQFYAKNFIQMLETIMQTTDMPPQMLELEITETMLMEHLDTAVEILNLIRSKGIRISIDDFGTGYSSMKYLRNLPVDVMKIDKIFVDNICYDNKDKEITNAMVGLGTKLGLEVIAEGIESVEQMHILKKIGCDTGQGYLFSKPVPFNELKKFIKSDDASRIHFKSA